MNETFTKYPNNIHDALMSAKLSGTQYAIVMFIMRNTYGFHRDSHAISISLIASGIDAETRYVGKQLQNLIDRKIVTAIAQPGKVRQLKINADTALWCNQTMVQKDHGVISTGGMVQKDHRTMVQKDHHRKKDKEIYKENIYCAFLDSIWKLYPNKKGKAQVSQKSIKKLYALGYDTIKTCIDRYKSSKPKWQAWQNGSTFFNSGYIDYLDENYQSNTNQPIDNYAGYNRL